MQIEDLHAELAGKERSLQALEESAAKLQPAEEALQSCRQQAASQAAQLKSLLRLEDRLAGEQQAAAASKERLQVSASTLWTSISWWTCLLHS